MNLSSGNSVLSPYKMMTFGDQNVALIGISNPNNLTPGTQLTLPSGTYVIEKGNAVDYDTWQFISKIQSQYEEALKAVLGHTAYPLTTLDPATGLRVIRKQETNLGNLTADAYRYVLETEIVLSNGGGIRSDLKVGNITYRDTLQVFPYGNMGTVIEATGQQIKDALEMGARKYPEENGGLLHVSGLTYTIDSTIKSSVETDDKGILSR